MKELVLEKILRYNSYTITDGDLSVFYRIADGTLSPLEGPMGEADFNNVLDNEVIERNKVKLAWTIPIVFPAFKNKAKEFAVGDTVFVKNERGVIAGLLEISDIYQFDKEKYNKLVYGTQRLDHPGPRIVNNDPRDYILGGKITAFAASKPNVYAKYLLTPQECRDLFKKRKWQRIIAFQTRNALHRAHEYAMVHSIEKLVKEGFSAGIVLNPLIGQTKNDDVPAEIRMKTYEALIDHKLIGCGDKDEELWRDKGYDITDQLLLIALDMKMFYAGPKEAVMHAIYRQNCGFTDIIIGRRHADAPFDDGTQAWGDFDAQEIFDNLKVKLSINPLKVGTAAYFEELGRVGFVDEFSVKNFKQISLSGKELREKIRNNEPIDERVMRRPVADILKEAYGLNIAEMRTDIKSKNITWQYPGTKKKDRWLKNKHKSAVIWLTGLPSSGKTTIAFGLEERLFKNGCNVFVLDGDNIRHGLNKNLGFSPEDRQENIRRIGEVAKLFVEAGFLVIASFVSPYKDDRNNVRSLFPNGEFMEVFVKASLAACEQRDAKGLYRKARAGAIKDFTGISAPYEEPVNPELIIDTEHQAKEESVQEIIKYLTAHNYISIS